MANTKSAAKNARKAKARTVRNKTVKNRLKTLAKKLQQAVKDAQPEAAKTAAAAYISAADKATKSGVIHKNAASRIKAHASKIVFAKA